MHISEINPNDPALFGCMATVSGRIINLMDFNPADVYLSDIAHGLAHNFRWNGHTSLPYTVAEHCVRVHDQAPPELKRLALFHDCEEAYWGDMIRPIKMLLKELAPEVIAKMKETRFKILEKYGIEYQIEIEKYDHQELLFDFQNMILKSNYTPLSPEAAKEEWGTLARLYIESPLPQIGYGHISYCSSIK